MKNSDIQIEVSKLDDALYSWRNACEYMAQRSDSFHGAKYRNEVRLLQARRHEQVVVDCMHELRDLEEPCGCGHQ